MNASYIYYIIVQKFCSLPPTKEKKIGPPVANVLMIRPNQPVKIYDIPVKIYAKHPHFSNFLFQ